LPICKKCEEKFPFYIKINGKKRSLKSRVYCLNCSPFREKKGYKLCKSNNVETINCPGCQKNCTNIKNNICSNCQSTVLRWNKRNKAVDLLGSICYNCKNDDIDVLTFHHLNSDEKDIDLSSSWSKDWNDLENELKKCVLLCYNCHAKLHITEKRNKQLMKSMAE